MFFLNLLTLIFIVLKLTGYIQWDWIVVLSPTLAPITLVFVIAVLKSLSQNRSASKYTKNKYER